MEIYSNQEIMKKSLNSDVELNKKTYMICLALKNKKLGVIEILESDMSSSEKIDELRDYFEQTGIKEKTIKEIDRTFNSAKKILNNKGVIIVHRHKKDIIELTKKFKILEKRNYGISTIFFGN